MREVDLYQGCQRSCRKSQSQSQALMAEFQRSPPSMGCYRHVAVLSCAARAARWDQPESTARMGGRDRAGQVVKRSPAIRSKSHRRGRDEYRRGKRLTITRGLWPRARGCLSLSVSWLSSYRLNFVLAGYEADTNVRCWAHRTARPGHLNPPVWLLSAVERAHAVLDLAGVSGDRTPEGTARTVPTIMSDYGKWTWAVWRAGERMSCCARDVI